MKSLSSMGAGGSAEAVEVASLGASARRRAPKRRLGADDGEAGGGGVADVAGAGAGAGAGIGSAAAGGGVTAEGAGLGTACGAGDATGSVCVLGAGEAGGVDAGGGGGATRGVAVWGAAGAGAAGRLRSESRLKRGTMLRKLSSTKRRLFVAPRYCWSACTRVLSAAKRLAGVHCWAMVA